MFCFLHAAELSLDPCAFVLIDFGILHFYVTLLQLLLIPFGFN